VEVFVVIREDQNDHGFVDTNICGVFRSREGAEACVVDGKSEARADGFRVEGAQDCDWEEANWQVYYKIETHDLD
jgi:hypothetical protein